MILGTLKNIPAFLQLDPRFQKAFDFILANDLTGMETGKIALDGDKLFITIAELEGKAPETAKIEAHHKYIDIQVVLQGQEIMGWNALENCTQEIAPYDPDKDIVFYTNAPSTYVTVQPGEFVVFYPEDGHAPAIGTGAIKKAIVKVLA
jgi:YhcH/YjgK/YiaL family protein